MRFLFHLPLLGLLTSAQGGIEATIVTSRGSIRAGLDFEGAPLTVANFLSLAEGGSNWVDSASGSIRTTPFYDGLAFHDIVNEAGDRRIGTGSRDGSARDHPGYLFCDEVTAPLAHTPYILAMSNDGPNTNGSRIYFTGDVSQPDRDGIHIVFGNVDDVASRLVIDEILTSNPGETTITGIIITRSGVEAESFDQFAQGLPVVEPLQVDFRMSGVEIPEVIYSQTPGSEVRGFRSLDLKTWVLQGKNFLPPDQNRDTFALDLADRSSAFYRLSETSYDNALGLSGFANKILETETPTAGRIVYTFDETGLGGTYQNIISDPITGDLVFFQGSFEVRDRFPAWYGAHSFSIYLYLFNEPLGGSPFNLIKGGYDLSEGGAVIGRQITGFYSQEEELVMKGRGPLSIE